MFDTTADLAADIKRQTAELRSQLNKLDAYADALAEVKDDYYVAAIYAPGRIADMLGTFGRTTASATATLLSNAARTAISAEQNNE